MKVEIKFTLHKNNEEVIENIEVDKEVYDYAVYSGNYDELCEKIENEEFILNGGDIDYIKKI